MRHRATWALSLALLASVGALSPLCSVGAQEPQPTNATNPNNGNWLNNWLPFGQPAPKKAPSVSPKTPPTVSIAVLREREKQAYFRRVEVCEKLMRIASATKDADLERRVEDLQDRNLATYLKHMALLPVPANDTTDDRSLANHLSPGDSADRLSNGPGARPASNAVSQAPIREEGR